METGNDDGVLPVKGDGRLLSCGSAGGKSRTKISDSAQPFKSQPHFLKWREDFNFIYLTFILKSIKNHSFAMMTWPSDTNSTDTMQYDKHIKTHS